MVFGFGKKKYAPKYNHGPQPVQGGQAAARFPNAWLSRVKGLWARKQ